MNVTDNDLRRFASGMVAESGFEKLFAALCAGTIGTGACSA
ncbi:hypothetical protein [Paracoccus versutus]|nr:hypothetical protein [Paracoccus versutus]